MGRKPGSKNKKGSIRDENNGKYPRTRYDETYVCDTCGTKGINFGMHAKTRKHKENVIIKDETLSVEEKYTRLGMLRTSKN